VFRDGKYTAQTFRAAGKKRFLDRDDDKALDSTRMGAAGRSFEDWLTAWLVEHGVQHCAIEAPLNTNFQRKRVTVDPAARWAGQGVQKEEIGGAPLATFFKIHMLEGIACTVCSRLNIPTVFVNQGTWRKAFLGNGRPKDAKREAKAMCDKLGIECSSLDAAEAVGVCWWLNGLLNPYGLQRANDLFKSPQT
jgi:hypothetical protein